MNVRCPACESSAGGASLAVREFEFCRCRSCRSLFLTEAVIPSAARGLYTGDAYFANPDFGSPETGGYHGYKDYLADRAHIEDKFKRVLAQLERYVPPGRLVDVGSGPGLMVAAAAARGWDATGLDLNPWAARHAREEVDVDVREQSLEQAAFEDESFDAVTMMDVLEHVVEPGRLVQEASRITRAGGALAVLTPDAGSPVSRLLSVRWPEIQRVPEHVVLFSVAGLTALLRRHGYSVVGWHSIGKTSELRTLAADVAPATPRVGRVLQRSLERARLGGRAVELDPRTKFVLYARRGSEPRASSNGLPTARSELRALRVRKPGSKDAERTVADDLEKLARARRLCDWMFAQYTPHVRGSVVEIGAGIGTFSDRLLAAGAERLLLLEPEPSSAEVLARRYAGSERVRLAAEKLPAAPTLAAEHGSHDFVLCQNVLEHIEEDGKAVDAMAAALKPGGHLTLLVPAHPRLFNSLDRAYGHWRRYDRDGLRRLVERSGLEPLDLYCFNLLGVPGWSLSGLGRAAELGSASITAFDLLVAAWRPLEQRLRPPWGLSLVAHARRAA